MNTRIYWLHALSPTHPGIGRGVGYIDLPIDRDGVTGWPIIRASSFKGVWADHWKATEENRDNDAWLRAAFGRVGKNNDSNAGALIPTDARLVCLPVRSFRGTFAWCTSPLCLSYLHRTLSLSGCKDLPKLPQPLSNDQAHHAKNSVLMESNKIYLEDLDFGAKSCEVAAEWAKKIGDWVFGDQQEWKDQFKKRFVILPDSAFDFLCETGTEVHTRIKIKDDTKTVATGALWTEESIPTETILAGIIQCDRFYDSQNKSLTAEELLDKFAPPGSPMSLQIGGKATVGRGQMHCTFTKI